MKIGILYICTGKYKIFWKDFYLSCEKYFINEVEKEYFVFTDSPEIDFEKENPKIHRMYQENLGWPDNTLKRYNIFLKIKEKIEKTDFLFYLNANLLFLKKITIEDFLPQNQEKLLGCLHPGYYNQPIKKYTYENNRSSKAYINKKEGMYYFAGGINGGKTENFIEVIKILDKNIEDDLKIRIIAKWHDESHWNWYLNNHLDIVKTLSPSYLYPENSFLPFEPKILIRDKKLLGGHTKLRSKIEIRLIINKIKTLIKNILLVFKPIKIIKIQGGLGNQMFQYAHGRNLMVQKNKEVIFDVSFFKNNSNDTKRVFSLNNFNLNNSIVLKDNKENIFKKLGKKILTKIGIKYEEYYQNEKYFKDIKNIIKEEFILKNPLANTSKKWEEKIKISPISVSIHIRRGDYVNDPKTNKYHGFCGIEYYKKAIDLLKNKIGENFEIFIFSDDIEWAKNNLSFNQQINFVSSPEIPDYEEMYLMSLCKHNIIANSTFSWWGAWLNKNPDKIVIGPKQWFVKKTSEELDILPSSWIKI